MTHTTTSRRTTLRRARWHTYCAGTIGILRASRSPQDQQDSPAADIANRRWCDTTDLAPAETLRLEAEQQFSDPFADVATAMALLGFAVNNGWLYADDLASAREYFADTPAQQLVERILASVHTHPTPRTPGRRSSC